MQTSEPQLAEGGAGTHRQSARNDVLEFLRQAIVELADGLGSDDIEDYGHLFDFGYVDSLSAVMLLARIEEEFGVAIEDMDLVENLWSIGLLADRIAADR